MRRPLAALAVAATTLTLLLGGCANDASGEHSSDEHASANHDETDGAQESDHATSEPVKVGGQAAERASRAAP